ncbi:signal transducer and activator of transcription 5B-like [Planococcus citri]|uniref:signal transducer and activator of transcription 5B-like n=1 Tax=Planococcus citri TaxID=170843 RepID=UPI0031F851FF
MSHQNGMDQECSAFILYTYAPNRDQWYNNIEYARFWIQQLWNHIKSFNSDWINKYLVYFQKYYQEIIAPELATSAWDHLIQDYYAQINNSQQAQQRSDQDQQFFYKSEELKQYLGFIMENLEGAHLYVSKLIHELYNTELGNWKRNQQAHGNGYNLDCRCLDLIQSWCKDLVEILSENKKQFKEMKLVADTIARYIGAIEVVNNVIIELDGQFTKLTHSLMKNTFVLELQPPQVLKTGHRFSAKIRLLSFEGIKMSSLRVKVSILNAQQGNKLHTQNEIEKNDVSGVILNNTGTMKYDQAKNEVSLTFEKMQLQSVKRSEKTDLESVTDEKFTLNFTTEFEIEGESGNETAKAYTLSLPVTVVVHGNQEPNAWATIFWDNAFAVYPRELFTVPNEVNWGKLGTMLNMKFASVTGKGLSANNLKYLAEKLLGVQGNGTDDYNSMTISWKKFYKEKSVILLENGKHKLITFWEWLYAIMKLTKDHLEPFWKAGRIHGFLDKNQVEGMLKTCPNGTFVLRYSNSVLGAVHVAWVGKDTNGQKQVTMVNPFKSKDLEIRSLSDILGNMGYLTHLYPNIPKCEAFNCTPAPDLPIKTPQGYWGFDVIIRVRGVSSTPPQSPHSLSPTPAQLVENLGSSTWPEVEPSNSHIAPSTQLMSDFIFTSTLSPESNISAGVWNCTDNNVMDVSDETGIEDGTVMQPPLHFAPNHFDC